MTWTAFKELSFYWTTWTLFEALWIGMLWSTRSRVPGRAVYWFRPARRIRRGACERRVDMLLEKIEQRGVPEQDRPDKEQLVDRWHRIVAGRCASAPFQVVPLLIVLAPFWPLRPTPEGGTAVSLKVFAALAVFGVVSIALMAADDRATDVSDPAGQVTTRAALFLELLLQGEVERRFQDSALDSHGKAFRRLCHALHTQARHLTREAPAAAREKVRQDTERLIAALTQQNERYLLSEGADRETAVCELARLISNTLRHSCRPRNSRDSLVVVGAHLLTDAPSSDGAAGTTEEPLPNRLLRWVGWLAAAAALFTGAEVLPDAGAATEILVLAGVFSVAAVFPPLRAVLGRAVGGLPGAAPANTGSVPDQAPPHFNPSSPPACAYCDRLSVTAGSTSVR
ncbi:MULTISPECIES: hypothetical protein [Streptomyces]|uniref:hypothetical protein n=1 Tax=Streptomyces TaxID=1883 RepID=UPI0016777534|nr:MULTISPECIES: hypothetical protein [Streptomyces]MBK3522086.1 hypothetical protein [Streptomyces sp. MBT70]GGS12234.1 hypothetical protein GCM10010236_78390 [Streptomyces eurythermus]